MIRKAFGECALATQPPRRRRTFLGVAIDDETRALLAGHLAAHLPSDPPGKPVPPQNWHLTLRFLGASTDVQIERVLYDLSERDLPARFVIRFGGMGAFPRSSRAAVLFLRVDSVRDGLGSLAAACEDAAVAAGFSPEDRPFRQHLTLARVRPPANVSPLIEEFPPFDVRMAVAEMTLFESHNDRDGVRYEAIETMRLRPG